MLGIDPRKLDGEVSARRIELVLEELELARTAVAIRDLQNKAWRFSAFSKYHSDFFLCREQDSLCLQKIGGIGEKQKGHFALSLSFSLSLSLTLSLSPRASKRGRNLQAAEKVMQGPLPNEYGTT